MKDRLDKDNVPQKITVHRLDKAIREIGNEIKSKRMKTQWKNIKRI